VSIRASENDGRTRGQKIVDVEIARRVCERVLFGDRKMQYCERIEPNYNILTRHLFLRRDSKRLHVGLCEGETSVIIPKGKRSGTEGNERNMAS
jgi:hypothetical protein